MIITRLLKNIFAGEPRGAEPAPMQFADDTPRVLNVGGNNKDIPLPGHYRGWHHLLLDIAPNPGVDIVLDARKLMSFEAERFDAVYCSHNLEHYFRHDAEKVLAGFLRVLKPDGHAEIIVPNIDGVLKAIVSRGLDIDDVLYVSNAGPITAHDVIYGLGREIEQSGVDFYAHKRGFTPKSLELALRQAGFEDVRLKLNPSGLELSALAFKATPTAEQRARFGY